MARNEEKNLAALNRLILQQQREDHAKKHPRRPKLDTLSSAAQVRNWLPSIVDDISFNLKQSQVPCYPQAKIEEHRNAVDRLRKEHTAYLNKLRSLDSDYKTSHWANRPYKRLNESRDEEEVYTGARIEGNTRSSEVGDSEISDSSGTLLSETTLLSTSVNSSVTRLHNITSPSLPAKLARVDVSERICLPVMNLPLAAARPGTQTLPHEYKQSDSVDDTALALSEDTPLEFNSDWLKARHVTTTAAHPLGITYGDSDCSSGEDERSCHAHDK